MLTRNSDYTKEKEIIGPIARHALRDYPKILNAMESRHIKYNITLEKLKVLEEEGFVYIFRPIAPLEVDRLEKDKEKLKDLYEQGYNEALSQMEDFKKMA